MTPKKAIEAECRSCKNGQRFDCESSTCKLDDRRLPTLKRIKAHCLDCVGGRAEVLSCMGNILNPTPHKCALWAYRLGTNPALKGKGGNISNLRLFVRKVKPSNSDLFP